MKSVLEKKSALTLIYLATLFYSLSYALPLYVGSSFLSQSLTTEEFVGIIFTLGALLGVVGTLLLPTLLRKFGNYRITLTIVALEVLILIILGYAHDPLVVIGAFIVNQLLVNVLYFNLNIFLEALADIDVMGKTRGIFLTVVNGAILLAPFLAGLLLVNHSFTKIYLASAVFMAGVFLVLWRNLKTFTDPLYKSFSWQRTLRTIKRSHNLHAIIAVQFVLNFFYAWMVIYTPIYLNTEMGISTQEFLTIIMPIALLPFVLFQTVLGKIADKTYGEQEILVLSIVITALSTISMAYVHTGMVLIWAAILFMTRLGASAMEIMSESYFYKQVDPKDADVITFLFVSRIAAYVVAPLLGSLTLFYVGYGTLFIILGLITLASVPLALHFKDSR